MKWCFCFAGVFFMFFTCWTDAEAKWTITIDASAKQGPSRVKNFICVQGAPMGAGDEVGSSEGSRQFEIAAWKALDPTMDIVYLIDGEPGQGLHVVRSTDKGFSAGEHLIGPLGPKQDLYVDTREFDMMQQYFKEIYGGNGFRRVFSVGYMPKTLSSNPSAENFYTYPPADYAEWRAVLQAAVRHLNAQGIHEPYINIFGEPESDTIWNVLAPDRRTYPAATEPVLREYVRMFAESQRAVKAADPGAKVSAMCSSVYSATLLRDLRQAPDHRGLDDFIAYTAEYNQSLPSGVEPAEIDNICWQGYSWLGEKRITPMAEHVRSALSHHGFDPEAPQYILGWSGGWAGPLGSEYPLARYAAHLIYNVIDQINPGGKPGAIAQAHYYTWNLEDNTNRSSLVRTVHRTIAYDEITVSVASDKDCLRPAYIAFLALKAMEEGDLLAATETRPELARSMATINQKGVHVLLVNYTDEHQKAQVSFKNLSETMRIRDAMLRFVPNEEVCGQDNWFPADDPLSLLLKEPLHFDRELKGKDIAFSVDLKPNTVALIEIPGT